MEDDFIPWRIFKKCVYYIPEDRPKSAFSKDSIIKISISPLELSILKGKIHFDGCIKVSSL
jgi:hypothetical protein